MTQLITDSTSAFSPAENQSLRRDVNLLGHLLGHSIRQHQGDAIFTLVETFRGLTKSWRSENSNEQLDKIMAFCEQVDVQDAPPLLKAFTTYFHLVNLAESNHRLRILRAREHQHDKPLSDSLEEAVYKLHQQGVTAEEMQALLDKLYIGLVFTAHPTEAKRRSILEKLRQTSFTLIQLDYDHWLPREEEAIREELNALVDLLWLTNEVRTKKPTVADEVKNGLWYFAETLFDVIPRLNSNLERALRQYYPDTEFKIPPMFRFGSWIGGDRDGNPFVTAKVTQQTYNLHEDLARQTLSEQLRAQLKELSIHVPPAKLPSNLQQFLREQAESHVDGPPEYARYRRDESYRQMLSYVNHHLSQPATIMKEGILYEAQTVYSSGQSLLKDLTAIADGLARTSPLLAKRRLEPLLYQVETFGLHTAELDIRQHSAEHEAVVTELLRGGQLSDNYASLSEAEKCTLLGKLLNDSQYPLVVWDNLSEKATELLELFLLLRRTQRRNPQLLGPYMISMAHEPSDVLEVLWLAGLIGLYQPNRARAGVMVVPLLETVADLQRAEAFLETLYQMPAYQPYLKLCQNEQMVQLGYSDGTKDGGYLMANWQLYDAQRQIGTYAKRHDITMTIFHGRGGSVGRGGGPTHRAIRGLPPIGVDGRIRITEQGEVIFDRFGHPELSLRYLEQVAGAMLQVAATPHDNDFSDRWGGTMQELAQIAYTTYRSLVYETPDFIEYFNQATPIDIVTELTIGSRPAKRTGSSKKNQHLDDLRAIPWVFAWTQSRNGLPGWYGLGSAFEWYIEEHGLDTLQIMYREWLFFQSLLSNAQMSLAKADMNIASSYANLVNDIALRRRIFRRIEAEYDRAKTSVLQILGQEKLLDDESVLQRAIALRNPYVDPLNFMQISLLRQLRSLPADAPERAKLLEGLRLSIVGIAAGLKNMG